MTAKYIVFILDTSSIRSPAFSSLQYNHDKASGDVKCVLMIVLEQSI